MSNLDSDDSTEHPESRGDETTGTLACGGVNAVDGVWNLETETDDYLLVPGDDTVTDADVDVDAGIEVD